MQITLQIGSEYTRAPLLPQSQWPTDYAFRQGPRCQVRKNTLMHSSCLRRSETRKREEPGVFWWHPVKWIIHFDHNDIGGYSLLLSKQSQVPKVGTGTKQWSSRLWSLPFGLGVGLGVGGLTGFHHCALYFTDIDTAQALGYLEHLSSSFVAQTVVTFTIR